MTYPRQKPYTWHKMGTRSRLIINRRVKKPIYLWMHWDGYFDGVGLWLCNELKALMEKYSISEIKTMIYAIDMEDNTTCQSFKTNDLIPFIEGKTKYKNDTCDDIEYEYTLDIDLGTFAGSGHDKTRILWLDQIRTGMDFNSDVDESHERASDKVNVIVEMVRASMKTLSESEKNIAIGKIKDL